MRETATPVENCANDTPRRCSARRTWLLTLLVMAVAGHGFAQLTVTPITWDVVGLDSNRPLTSGPELFPVGAEVCAVGAPSAGPITVDFIWPDGNGGADPYINSRPGSLTTLSFAALAADECIDAYFELQLTRSASAFGSSREYYIEATDGTDTVTTPRPRQIYVEYLVSQNRNTTSLIRYGQQADQSDWQTLGNGGSINLLIGETYFIELTTATSTAYEELQSFLTLSNTIFQVLSVSTTYGVQTAPLSRVPDPNPQLWADGCLWDSDPDSPNYLSCLSDGKAGGQVVTTYEIRIISGGGDQVGLEALIYDRSGGSYHYNTDFSQSPGDLTTVDPAADAGFSKRFIPSTIGADGISTLRLTITNPNPVQVSGYSFTDSLPTDGTSQMEVAATPNVTNTCGGTVTAVAGSTTISFTGGALAASSSCTILVDVTVPDVAGATYPLAQLNSVDLYVGAAATPTATASATLNVTAQPAPPLNCTASIAEWTSFTATNNPNHPPTGPAAGLGVTTNAGPGITTSVDASNRWVGEIPDDDTVIGDLLANARSLGQYYEFVVDTTGIDQVSLSFVVSRQNGNGPQSIGLDYGPQGGPLTLGAQTWSGVSTQAGTPSTFTASNLVDLNASGNTVFRFYIYNAINPNIAFRIHQMTFTGSGASYCTPFPPGTEPDPPTLSKAFSPDTVSVSEVPPAGVSTLTFTLTNPNTSRVLTGITFRDELPAGITAVTGSFSNGCGSASSWSTESGDPGILLFTDGSLAGGASCTVSVNVISDTVGDNVNASDPIDSNETYPGNSAVDTLTVLPPPTTPTIAKYFDPNPLLEPTGSTLLTFEITNTDQNLAIASVAVDDPLPSGMQPVSPLTVTDNGLCGGSYSLTYDGGANALSFSGGDIAAGDVCVVAVEIEVPGVDVSTGPVTFVNQTGPVSHVFNGITIEGNDARATLVVDNPIPGISFLKQVGGGSDPDGAWSNYLALELGDQVYYRLTVENTGETILTGIDVSDPTLDVSSCSWPASLPVADAASPLAHIAVCIVGPIDVTVAGGVPNTATASGDSGATELTDADSATRATVELGLDKAASPTTYTAAGQDIDYTFTVTNDGAAILPGPVSINDALIAGVTCPALTTVGNNDNFFDPSESIDCTGTYTTQAADVSAGSVTNTAWASVDGFFSPEDSAIVTVPVAPTPTPTPTNTPVPPTPTPTQTPVPPTPTPTETPVPPTPTPTNTPVPPTPTPTETPVPPTPTPTETPVPPTPTPTNTPVPPTPTPTNTPVPPTPTPTNTPVPPTPTPTETPVPPTPTPTETPVPPTPTPTETPVPPTPTPTETPVPPTPTNTPVPPTPTPTNTPVPPTPTPSNTPVPPTPTPTNTPVPPPTVTLSASKSSSPGSGMPVKVGDAVTYELTLEVSNGPITADALLTDTLGDGLTFESVTSNPGGFIVGGSGNVRTFILPSGAVAGTYRVAYTARVDADATGSTVNNVVLIAGGGDPDPTCTSCSTGHVLASEIQAIPTASTWGLLIMIAMIAGAAALRLRMG